MGEKYRPANGTEGIDFYNRFCDHCQKDRAHREDPDGADGCPILAATFRFEVDDPSYPAEWIWREGDTLCTAYERECEDDRAPRCEKTIDLFQAGAKP